jgi:hypothetical protein
MGRQCSGHGELKNFVKNPEGKRSLGRPKYRCEDNIQMDLKETGL